MIDLVSFATGAGIGGFYHIYKGVLLLIEKLKTLVTQAEIARLEKFNLEVATRQGRESAPQAGKALNFGAEDCRPVFGIPRTNLGGPAVPCPQRLDQSRPGPTNIHMLT